MKGVLQRRKYELGREKRGKIAERKKSRKEELGIKSP
jgi:hypothetical protein